MPVKIKDYRKNRGHGRKLIWHIFCLEVALYSKQTEMGLDFTLIKINRYKPSGDQLLEFHQARS